MYRIFPTETGWTCTKDGSTKEVERTTPIEALEAYINLGTVSTN